MQRSDENRDSSSRVACGPAGFVRLAEGDFHRSIAATHAVAAVLFTTPTCSTCQAWKRLLPDALDGVADALYEVDVVEATGVARGYDIFHLPTIYLYREGRFHAELQCEARPEAIRHTALRLLDAPAQEEP